MSDDPTTLPFRVVVDTAASQQSGADADALEVLESAGDEGDAWSLDDIENAYQQALESLDTLDATVSEAIGETDLSTADDNAASELAPHPADIAAETTSSFFPSAPVAASAPTVTSRQVLESLLFVGGMTLPSRKLADVLAGSTTSEDVLRWIDELNKIYDSDGRPYRIELVDGGYRMQLRSEFEKVRHRVFGIGPREVKLSQEVLEILAFVAYSQPVSQEELEGLGRDGIPAVIRQLLRRELIQLKRGDQTELRYETAPRFLEVFGLRTVNDLPLPGDFAFK